MERKCASTENDVSEDITLLLALDFVHRDASSRARPQQAFVTKAVTGSDVNVEEVEQYMEPAAAMQNFACRSFCPT